MAEQKKDQPTDGNERSSLPDLQEVTEMTQKLYKDVKKSVSEIYQSYKSKRADENTRTKGQSE